MDPTKKIYLCDAKEPSDSQCGPWTNSINLTWEFVGHANSHSGPMLDLLN